MLSDILVVIWDNAENVQRTEFVPIPEASTEDQRVSAIHNVLGVNEDWLVYVLRDTVVPNMASGHRIYLRTSRDGFMI